VLTPADEAHHIDKWQFTVPFVCGATNLGEALRRIAEGAAMIRSKGEAGTGDVVEAVTPHAHDPRRDPPAVVDAAPTSSTSPPRSCRRPRARPRGRRAGKLPVVLFTAGGIATPADAAMMMQLGADGVFVGSGIFKSGDPEQRARGHRQGHDLLRRPRRDRQGLRGLGEAMVGINVDRQVDSFEADLDIPELGPSRSARCSSAPRGSSRWARTSRCSPGRRRAAPTVRSSPSEQGVLLATSFHPELTGDRGCMSCSSRWSGAARRGEKEHARMSGHSKWATTKHKKAVVDARRGKLFAKLIKNIEVAARIGGADPDGNPTLYDAMQKAKKNSVPNDNIDRAVKRGSVRRPAAPTGRRSCTRATAPTAWRAGRVPHRQPQPGRHRGAHGDDPQRRHDGRPRLRVLPVRPQGRRDRAEEPRA
jgi:hypothetical protein